MTTPAITELCPGCFADKGLVNVCPHCGYDESLKRGPLVLPHRTLLHQGQYLIGKVLGKPGGFGITYLALDTKLETRVAIKEYLPRDLAGRDGDHATVSAHSSEDGEFFRYGLTQFLQEARTLARFDHANIVRVRNFFEENGTGYLVMDYYDGITLADYLSQQPHGKLPEKTAVDILMPILDGLREVHAKNFLHRDIKPQNIYLTTGNRAILLDFGAARQAMSERSRSVSVVLSEGYAPYEQYHRRGEQGPWTDIYACAAVLYHAVAGQAPPPATERVAKDELDIGSLGVSASLANALRLGLATDHHNRPQRMTEFQALLLADGDPTGSIVVKPRAEKITPRPIEPTQSNNRPGLRKWWVAALVVVVVIVEIVAMSNREEKNAVPTAPAPSSVGTQPDIKPVAALGSGNLKGASVTYREEKKSFEPFSGRPPVMGTTVVALIDGKRLEVPGDVPGETPVALIAQKDFNGDGVMDALIEVTRNFGGNTEHGETMFITVADGKFVMAPVAGKKIVEEGGRFLVKSETYDATEYWGFDGQKAVQVRSIRHPLTTIESTVICLQNSGNNNKECPYIWGVLRDDKAFRENLVSIFFKSTIAVTEENDKSWVIGGGVTSGFHLISENGKTYLETSQCEPHRCSHYMNMLLEIEGRASGGSRIVAAYFPYDSIEPTWLNVPSVDEKLLLIKNECSRTPHPSECDLHKK